MSVITSHLGQGNAADIVIAGLTLASAAPFAVVIPAQVGGAFVVVDSYLRFTLPANHGGLRVNWLVPAAWPLVEIRQDWTIEDIGQNNAPERLIAPAANGPQHTDGVCIAPGIVARSIRMRASHLFRSPAAGATINLQASKISAAASPTLEAFSHLEVRMFT